MFATHKYLAICSLLGIALSINCMGQSKSGAKSMRYSVKELDVLVGGRPAISLSQEPSADRSRPEILNAEILPGRGMNTYQLRAYVPGKGVIELFGSPGLEKARDAMVSGPGHVAIKTFGMGGPILLPWANRIRGKVSPDEKTIEAVVRGKKVLLPANGRGKKPGAELHSIHGLFLARAMDKVTAGASEQQVSVIGTLDAGDFEGHWLSKTYVTVTTWLKDGKFGFDVVAKNTGNETLPMAIGWHPYFVFPSGQREQVRLQLPARQRVLVNNYDDVFPTGQIVPVKGTEYDFSAPGGAPLKQLFLDDCFVNLEKNGRGHAVAEIADPVAKYGIRIRALSKEIRALQVFAPLNRNVIAVEPQFNVAEPFSKIWGEQLDTGMVLLRPGQSVTYSVELELFVP